MSLYEAMKEGWYLIKTKARQEQRACEHLENQGFNAYCPFMANKNATPEPLFPGYLFLYLDLHGIKKHHKISSTRGVNNFVRFNQVGRGLYADGRISIDTSQLKDLLPQPIPNGHMVIQQIREMVDYLQAGQTAKTISFNTGDTVTICNPLYDHLKVTFVKGISMDRGMVLVQYIREQRNASGVLTKAKIAPVKTMKLKLSDIKKADEV
ncbi:MAG: transcription termination/antitermination NusG family protein [Endozoicomonas sp. (ex Botrylloides leachii)]|nr:transcription termination/antitermination NusG family protein [Endozoicomonas sp. (ex Botrylloides leachii)]